MRARPITLRPSGLVSVGLVLGISGLAVAVVAATTSAGAATTPDSLSYIDAARNLRDGLGLSLPDFNLGSERDFRPITAWPPAYPALLSVLPTIENAPEDAVRWLSAILLAVTSFLVYFCVRSEVKGRIGPWVAAGTAALSILAIPMITVYTYVWSETLFIPLTLLAFYCATRPSRGRFGWHLVVGGIAAMGMVYTRYIGIGLLPALAVSVYASGTGRKRTRVLEAAAVTAAVVISVVPLLVSNLIGSGFVTGGNRGVSPYTLGENLAALGTQARMHLGPAGGWHLWLLVAGVVTIILAGYKIGSGQRKGEDEGSRQALRATLWLTCYYVTLLGLASFSLFDRIDTRLVAPGLPFVFVAAGILFGKCAERTRSRAAGWQLPLIPILLWTLILSWSGTRTALRVGEHARGGLAPALGSAPGTVYTSIRHNPDIAGVADAVPFLEMNGVRTLVVDVRRPKLVRHFVRLRIKRIPEPVSRLSELLSPEDIPMTAYMVTRQETLDALGEYAESQQVRLRADHTFGESGFVLVVPEE